MLKNQENSKGKGNLQSEEKPIMKKNSTHQQYLLPFPKKIKKILDMLNIYDDSKRL